MRRSPVLKPAARRRLTGSLLAVAAGTALVAMNTTPALAAGNASTPLSTSLKGGPLSIAVDPSSANYSFTLNGTDQAESQPLSLQPSDLTGTGNGWDISVSTTPLQTASGTVVTDGWGMNLNGSPSDIMDTGALSASVNGTGTYTLPVQQSVAYPVPVPGLSGGSDVPSIVFVSQPNSGLGSFAIPSDLWMSVPANALAGDYSSTVTWMIASGPFGATQSIGADDLSASNTTDAVTDVPSVDLTWSAPGSEANTVFDIYRDNSLVSSTSWALENQADADNPPADLSLSWADRHVTPGTNYSYWVQAASAGLPNAISNVATVTPQAAVPTPVLLSATTSPGETTLTWTASPDKFLAGYDLYRDGVLVASPGASTTSFVDQAVTGTTHTYALDVRDTFGQISSGSVVVTQQSGMTLALTPGAGALSASWSSFAGASSYQVSVDGSVVAPGLSGTQYNASGLTGGQSYSVRVDALNASGSVLSSATATATPLASEPTESTTTSSSTPTSSTSSSTTSSSTPTSSTSSTSSTSTSTTAPSTTTTTAARNQVEVSLSATPAVNGAVLNWTASPDPDGAHIDILQGTSLSQIASEPFGTTGSYTVAGLDPSSSVLFTVEVVQNDGSVAIESAPVMVAPQPAAPADLAGIAGLNSMALTWAPVTGAASYLVAVDGTITQSAISGTSYTVDGLASGTQYNFSVSAIPGDGASNSSSAITTSTLSLPAPSGFTATASVQAVTLSWSPVADTSNWTVASYQLYRDGALAQSLLAGLPAYSFTDSGLVGYQSYSYSVQAETSDGVTGLVATATAVALPPGPAIPTGLSAAPTDGQVALTWTGAPGATSYSVWANGTVVCATSGTACTAGALTDGVAYTFSVTATNLGGTSIASAAVTATPEAPPGAPTGLTAAPSAPGTVLVSWAAPSVASPQKPLTYSVFSDGTPVASGLSATSYSVNGLTGGNDYAFTVTATDSYGQTGAASSAASTMALAQPAAPSSVIAVQAGNAITVNWADPANTTAAPVTGYQVTGSWSFIAAFVTGHGENVPGSCTFPVGTVLDPNATSMVDSTWSSQGCLINSAWPWESLVPGDIVTYSVTALNTVGSSGPAATSVGTVGGTTLTASASSAEVHLSWAATTNATGYQVFENGSLAYETANTTWTAADLVNGVAYSFSVVPQDNYGDAGAASALVTSTPEAPPGAPASLSATAQDGSALVTWAAAASQAPQQPLTYTVYADGQVAASDVSATSAVVPGLTDGTSYSVTVAATDSYGQTGALSAATAVTPVGAPAAPSGVTAAQTGGSVTVTWAPATSTAAGPVSGYYLYRSDQGSTPIATVPGATSASFTDTSFVPGSSYTYSVAAYGPGGTSARATAATLATLATPAAPALVPGDQDLQVSWPSTPGASGYQVFVNSVLAQAVSGTSYTASGLTDGTSYSVQVAATGPAGVSLLSASASAVPRAVPPVPANLAVSAVGDGQVTLSWSPVVVPTGQEPLTYTGYDCSGAGCNTFTSAGTTSGTTLVVNGLSDGTVYSFTVAATDLLGDTSAQATAITGTPAAAPATPSGLIATAGPGSVTLSWTAVSGTTSAPLTGYNIYRSSTSATTGFTEIASVTTDNTEMAETANTAYWYAVSAYGVGGESVLSTSAFAMSGASTFAYNGTTAQSWTAPFTGTVQVALAGGSGGEGAAGAAMTADIPVTAGETLSVYPAAAGSSTGAGGWGYGSGGQGGTVTYVTGGTGGGGGGASALTGANGAMLVAGGGGGAGIGWSTFYCEEPFYGSSDASGGTGGRPTGGSGVSAGPATGGTGGGNSGLSGGNGASNGGAGGGGGGGYNGGAGGGAGSTGICTYEYSYNAYGAGGGGGSSYAYGPATNVSYSTSTGNGSVAITYAVGAPTVLGLTATPSSGQVALSWTGGAVAAQGPLSYSVYEDGTLVQTGLSSPAYTFTGLTNGAQHSFAVVATDAYGEVGASASVSAAAIGTPAAPSGLSATQSGASVALKWAGTSSAAAPVTGYYVDRNGTQVATVTSGTTWADTSFSPGTAYTYTVAAYNGAGTSAPATASLSTLATTSLSSTPSDSQVALSWSTVSGATSYTVYQNSVAVHVTTSTSWVAADLADDTAYSFTVVAGDASGDTGLASNTVTATPEAAPGAPGALVATATSGGAQVSWGTSTSQAPQRPLSYVVYVNGQVADSGLSATSTTLSGLANGQQYSVTVAAIDAYGQSSAEPAAVLVTPLGTPAAPTAASATEVSGSPTLSWTPASSTVAAPVTGYYVYRADKGSAPIATVSGASSSSYTDNTAGPGTYTYAVAAFNAVATSSQDVAPALTDVGSPATPAAPTAAPSAGQAVLTWSSEVNTTSYNLFQNGTLVYTGAVLTYTATGLTNDTVYSFTLTASGPGGTSAASPAATATPESVPSVPTAVTASVGSGQVGVSWTAPSTQSPQWPISYQVSESANGGSYSAVSSANGGVVSSSATGTISTTVLNLAGGSSYTFEVTATDAYGQASAASGASAPVTPYTSSDPVPTGLALTAGNGAVSATWAAVTGGTINGYDLYTNGMLAKSVLGISTTSAALSGLTNGTTYAVTIASTDSSGGVSHQSAAMYVTPSAYAGQVVSDGASSYLQLNDPSGATTAADVSGHSANGGTIATAGVAEGGAAANSILGGGSYTISGSSSTNGGNSGYVKVPASQFPATVASPGLTLETWLKTTATGGSLMGVQTAVPGSTPGSYFNTFYVGTNGELYGGQYNSGAGVKVCASSGTVTSGAWQLADLVYTATSLTLYLNGTQVCTESDGAAAFPSSGSYAQWGAAYSTVSDWTNSGAATGWHYFNGQLADSTIYQTALSASQVLNHYELGSGTAVAPSGLMVTQGSGPSASLSWTAGAGTTSYSIFRNSGGGAFSSLVSGLTSPSYSDTTVGYGASYGYYVVALSSTGTASSPSGTEYITPNPQEMVYVSNYTAGTVSAINEANNSTLATITVGTNPAGLAVSPNGQQVYVANRGGSVSVINTATDTVAATISVGNSPNWVAFTPNGAYAYVESCGGSGCGAVSTGSVSVINTATDQVVTGTGYPIAVGTTAHAIAISPNGTEAFVANEAASTISEIAIAPSGLPSSTTATTFTTGVTNPWDLAVTPNGNTLYVADGNGYATTFNTSCTSACVATGSVSGLASGPNGIGFNPTGTYAYVTSSAASSNSTAAINTSTLVATSISIGAGSLGTAGTPDGNYVYVANTSSNNISVVSLNPATGAPTCYTTCPTLTETGGPAGVATAYVPELVPTGVSASVNASGAAVIGWTAAAGASSYDVYRNGVLLQGAVSGTSYTDSTVVPGTTYSYYVTAVNASGLQSASSTTVYVTPSAYAAQVLADSPTYYWQLDEPTVTSPVGDISASHAGTGTSYTAGDTMQVSGTGSLGTAVGFTGGASRILGSEAWTDTGNASVELWFNTANAVSGYPLIAGNYAVLWVGTDGHLHGSWNGVTTAADNVVSSTTLAANTWYMADLTKSGTTLTLYVNGAQVAQTTTDGGAGGPGSFQVGGGYVEPSQPGAAASGNYTFTGSMSDVSAYSSALSAAQVSLDYDLGSGTAAVPSGLTVALNASDHPVLSWTTGAGDISYDVYRSGTEIASPATTIYTDTAALTGTTDGYYVTAVSSTGAQSSPTSTVYVTPSVYAAQVVVDNPVAYYQMDEPAGTVTGANLVGSTSSATYPSSSVAMGATSSNPVAGSAMDITGGTAAPTFVLSSTPSNTGGSYETAEFWMDWNGTINSSGETVFATSTGAANYSLYIRTVSGTTYIGINTSNGGDIYGEIIPSTVANHWVLVDAEFAYDAASSSKLFINGAPQTLAQEIGTPANGNATFSGTDEVSQPSSAYDVNGYFQDLSVYASALSAAQILNDYDLATGTAAPPTNLSATLNASDQPALSWTAGAGDLSYNVYRNGLLATTTTATTYTDTSTVTGTTYSYDVTGSSSSGASSAASSTVSITPGVYAAQVVADSPVVYWQLGDPSGTTASDNSPAHANPGIYSATGVTYNVAGPGSFGPAATFNGTSGGASGTLATAVGGGWSVEGWYKMSGLPTVVGGDPSPFATLAYYGLTGLGVRSDGHITVTYDNETWQETSYTLPASGWNQFAMSVTSAGAATIYINGAQVATTSSAIATGTYVSVGDHAAGRYFNGSESNVSFYNNVLTGAQINNDYYLGTVGVGDAGTPTATASLGSVALSWPATTGAASYDIFRNGALLYTAWTGGTSYTDSSVTNGDAYYYQVAAVAPGGSPTATSPSSATVVAGMVPASGTGLSGSEIEGVQTLTTSASTSYTGDPASAAFDNNTSTNWNAGTYSGSVQATWPVAEYLSAVHIWTSASPAQTVTITVYGYNGSSWVQIGSASPSIGTSTAETTVTLTSPGSYTGVKVSMSSASTWVDDAETTFN